MYRIELVGFKVRYHDGEEQVKCLIQWAMGRWFVFYIKGSISLYRKLEYELYGETTWESTVESHEQTSDSE